jgi:arylsulfatase A-like enzyme/Flp pilus assembly protein TadD
MPDKKPQSTQGPQRRSVFKISLSAMSAISAVSAAVIIAAGWFVWRPPAPSPPPSVACTDCNVLLLTIDTLRADRLGAYGGGALTPTLDRLAAGGVRFERAFSHVPFTLPAHASILTGQIPPRHGIHGNGSFRLGETPPTLATLLHAQGYRTGAFVGAFVLDSRFGLNRGFDTYDDRYEGERDQTRFDYAERPAEAVIKPALDWILASAGAPAGAPQPWFAWVHLFDPHAPYRAPQAFQEGRTAYDAEVAYTDASLGRLLDDLRGRGALDRTIVIVTADHGESLGEHGETTHGLFAYNATLRVPLLVAAPGLRPRVSSALASHADLVPTVLDLLGLQPPEAIDGRSLREALEREPVTGQSVYFEALDANLTRGWAPLTGVIQERVKYIDLPIPELYDLDADPAEQRNLAATPAGAAKLRALRAELEHWRRIGSTGGQTSKVALDPESRRRLESLGYVASGAASVKKTFAVSDDPKTLVALNESFTAALEESSTGRREQAVVHLQRIIAARPDFLPARTSLATILILTGRPSEAVSELQNAVRNGHSSPAVLAKLGAALDAAGRSRDAVVAFEQAEQAGERDPDLFNALGVAYARIGRRDEARRRFEQLLALDPTAASTWNNLGILEIETGNRRSAAEAFRRAVAVDPRYGEGWRGLGAALVADDRAGAARAWQRAVSLDPQDFDTLFNLAVVLAESAAPRDALPYLRRFAAEAPRDRYAADRATVTALIRKIETG